MQMFIVIGMFYALRRNKIKIFEWKKREREKFIAHSERHVN